ncbi:MAG: hypothetical protein GYB66_08900 [Chloroflexi bacterium]|nr:hypothetical protein [Chloroflexota bacterium]
MSNLPVVPRKWQLKAHGEKNVFVKSPGESPAHIVMKALLWALYLPDYPGMRVEVRIGDRYKPDLISLDSQGNPVFWGEAGKVSPDKIQSIARRFPSTHFALAKWDTSLAPHIQHVAAALNDLRREAPFDLIRFPEDSFARFIGRRGEIVIDFADVVWHRFA